MKHNKQVNSETRKVIAIGPTTQNNTVLNGATMIFQMTIDDLRQRGLTVKVVDIGDSKFNAKAHRVSGKFTVTKAINYIFIIIHIYALILFNRNSVVYLSTSQSGVGFIRDFLIISFAKCFTKRIVCQQLGANYINFYTAQPGYLRKLIKKNWAKADHIVVEGDYTKEQFSFLPDYKSKVLSVPNALPESIPFSDIQPSSIVAGQPIKLLYLSNLIETKGFWDVLEAAKILIKEKNVDLQIVFSGKFLKSVDDTKFSDIDAAKAAFQKYIQQHGIAERVTYYEGLYGLEKARKFYDSHFFLLPSYYINEGQPVSIIEALAYGCVPIVTRYRLIPMLVNEGNGFFVNPQAPSEIVDIVLKCIQNPVSYRQMSQNAIDAYLKNFTASRYYKDMYRIFFPSG